MDTAAADECRRCYARIGDWATEEGQAQGTECLATYEPNFAEMCGEKMQAFAVSEFLISLGGNTSFLNFRKTQVLN